MYNTFFSGRRTFGNMHPIACLPDDPMYGTAANSGFNSVTGLLHASHTYNDATTEYNKYVAKCQVDWEGDEANIAEGEQPAMASGDWIRDHCQSFFNDEIQLLHRQRTREYNKALHGLYDTIVGSLRPQDFAHLTSCEGDGQAARCALREAFIGGSSQTALIQLLCTMASSAVEDDDTFSTYYARLARLQSKVASSTQVQGASASELLDLLHLAFVMKGISGSP